MACNFVFFIYFIYIIRRKRRDFCMALTVNQKISKLQELYNKGEISQLDYVAQMAKLTEEIAGTPEAKVDGFEKSPENKTSSTPQDSKVESEDLIKNKNSDFYRDVSNIINLTINNLKLDEDYKIMGTLD